MEIDAARIIELLQAHPEALVREAVKAATWQTVAETPPVEPEEDG